MIYGYSVLRAESVVTFESVPPTRWERFKRSAREQWDFVIAPSIGIAVAVTLMLRGGEILGALFG